VQAGQSYEISNTGTVMKAEGDSFILSTFKSVAAPGAYSTVGQGHDMAQLFARPKSSGPPEPGPEPELEAESGSGQEPEPEAESESESEAESQAEAEPDPQPEPEPQGAEAQTQPNPSSPGVSPYADKARGRPAIASSSESAELTPRYAVDASSSTRWSSKHIDNQWWRVDLGAVRKVNRVSINWEAAFASSYRIETSRDGISYSTVARVSISKKGRSTTRFGARPARYVRIFALKRATQWGISFYDCEIFGPRD
jgi:hypothetical protein